MEVSKYTSIVLIPVLGTSHTCAIPMLCFQCVDVYFSALLFMLPFVLLVSETSLTKFYKYALPASAWKPTTYLFPSKATGMTVRMFRNFLPVFVKLMKPTLASSPFAIFSLISCLAFSLLFASSPPIFFPGGHCRNLQFRPRISEVVYPVRTSNCSEQYTIG